MIYISVNVEGSFEITSNNEAFPYQISIHSHKIGVVASIWRVRNLSEWNLIVKDDPLNTNNFVNIDDPLQKGDHIAIRCVYVCLIPNQALFLQKFSRNSRPFLTKNSKIFAKLRSFSRNSKKRKF